MQLKPNNYLGVGYLHDLERPPVGVRLADTISQPYWMVSLGRAADMALGTAILLMTLQETYTCLGTHLPLSFGYYTYNSVGKELMQALQLGGYNAPASNELLKRWKCTSASHGLLTAL